MSGACPGPRRAAAGGVAVVLRCEERHRPRSPHVTGRRPHCSGGPQPARGRRGATALDEERLGALVGQVVGDIGAAYAVPLVLLGDRLGLFDRLAEGPADAAELAGRAGLADRYVQEWLLAMSASGYVDHLGGGRFGLSPEQTQLFCVPDSPAYVAGGFQSSRRRHRSLDRLTAAFALGRRAWAGTSTTPTSSRASSASSAPATSTSLDERLDPGPGRAAGPARAGRPGRRRGLRPRGLHPDHGGRLPGVELRRAPTTTARSIELAQAKAAEAGLADRTSFEVAAADGLRGTLRRRS